MTLETILGYLSGLRWVAPSLEPKALLGTTAVLHICDAIMCRLFAHNNKYPKNIWTLLGLTFGIWAVAVLIFLPRRSEPPPR